MALKIAVVGLGPQGVCLAKALTKVSGVVICGLVDSNEAVQNSVKKESSLATFTTYRSLEQLFSDTVPAMLCIATDAASHIAVGYQALEKGVPRLFIEKPIGTSVVEVEAFLRECQKRKVEVCVNHSRRWSENYLWLKSFVEEKSFGELVSAHMLFGAGGFGRLGVHLVDILRFVTGEEIVEAWAEADGGDSDPCGRAYLQFISGVTAYIDLSARMKERQKFFTFTFERGRVELDEVSETISIIKNGERETRAFFHPDFQSEHRAFMVLSSLLVQGKNYSAGEDGLKALEVVAGMIASAQKGGGKVTFPLNRDIRERQLGIF